MPDFEIDHDVRRKAKSRRRLQWGGGALAGLLAIGAIAYVLPSGAAISRDQLVLGTVAQGAFAVRVQAPGVLKSKEVRFVTAAVPGSVARVLVQPGDKVAATTVLIELVNPQLLAAVLAAQANLADAQATQASMAADLENQSLSLRSDLAHAEAAAESADLRAQAEHGLADEHIVATLDYRNTVLLAADSRQQVGLTAQRIAAFARNQAAQLQAQAARVNAFAAALAEAQQNVAALEVTAGAPGVVQSVAAQLGQTLALGGAIAQLASLNDLKAQLAVAPSDAAAVAVGQDADIQLNDAQNDVVAGVVSRVSPSVIDGSVAVDVALPATLPAGSRAELAVLGNVDITTIAKTLFVARPVNAQPDSQATVYELIDGGTKAVPVTVRFGAASANAIEVLGGLAAGAQIIVSDTSGFAGQAVVRIK